MPDFFYISLWVRSKRAMAKNRSGLLGEHFAQTGYTTIIPCDTRSGRDVIGKSPPNPIVVHTVLAIHPSQRALSRQIAAATPDLVEVFRGNNTAFYENANVGLTVGR